MKVKDVVILKEVADDMNEEKAFYDQKGAGVGDYFWDSLFADIESLIIYAGIHNRKYGFHLLLLIQFAHDAADRIYQAIIQATDGTPSLKPILRPYDTIGSTRYVDFDTIRPVYTTKSDKCHISHTVMDSNWEAKMEETLEAMDEVIRYVKNYNLGFSVPYAINGEERQYYPDFIACLDDGQGDKNLLNLIIEITGERKKDKAAKVMTARTLWVPAINNHGGFGRWAFLEIDDPWDSRKAIREFVNEN